MSLIARSVTSKTFVPITPAVMGIISVPRVRDTPRIYYSIICFVKHSAISLYLLHCAWIDM